MNGEGVPVRCPACGRDHVYVPPAYPCACGTPLAPPIQRGAPPSPITHRTWTDTWVTVRCRACDRQSQWPQPELGCSCGTVLKVPVRPVTAPATAPAPAPTAPPPTGARRRGAFRPRTIRTARDTVTAAALYLSWLGFQRPASGGTPPGLRHRPARPRSGGPGGPDDAARLTEGGRMPVAARHDRVRARCPLLARGVHRGRPRARRRPPRPAVRAGPDGDALPVNREPITLPVTTSSAANRVVVPAPTCGSRWSPAREPRASLATRAGTGSAPGSATSHPRRTPDSARVGVQVDVLHLVRMKVLRFRGGDGVLAVSLLLSVRGGREAAHGGLGPTSVAGVEAVSSAV